MNYIPKHGDWVYLKAPHNTLTRDFRYEVVAEPNECQQYKNTVDLMRVQWSGFWHLLGELRNDNHGRMIIDKIYPLIREEYGTDKSIYYDLVDLIPCVPVECLVFSESKEDREKWGQNDR